MNKSHLLLFFCLILGISCNQQQQQKDTANEMAERKTYAKRLMDEGFLKYANPSMVDSLTTQLIDSFDIYSDNIFRMTHIDAEELAEFSFDNFMPGLNRILAKRGLELSVRKLNKDENSYDMIIDQDTIQLYKQNDLDNGSFWETASRNFFRKVNTILARHNNNEQFYLLYGGNDLEVILLTDRQYSLISSYYKQTRKEIPYKP
jgi:hypothetical protein